MNTEDIQAQLNITRDTIAQAIRTFHERTQQTLIGSFEVYIHADGRVDYRISADSQILYKASDSLDRPAMRVRVLEALTACHLRAGAVAPEAVAVLNEAFDAWRLKPTAFTFHTFAAAAQVFGIRLGSIE